jgi:hypothetical protein
LKLKKVEVCVTCGGPHAYYNYTATDGIPYEAHAIARTSNKGGNQYRPPMDPIYRPNHYPGPPDFNQNQNVQNRNQNQNRMNQGYQNQENFNQGQGFQNQNQGFQNQGNFNRNQGQGNFNQGYFHGNNNQNQGNFQHQGPNQNNRAQNFPNQTQAIVPTGPSSDELLKQFIPGRNEQVVKK